MSMSTGRPPSPVDWGAPCGDRYGIREIVELTGVPASSIHHYRRLGLVPEPHRTSVKQFLYDDRHVAALRLIRALRQRGRSLDEIREALPSLLHGDDERAISAESLDGGDFESDRRAKTKLIDAAMEAFSEHSFREVSIAGLCERAGVAKGTFYRWFDSKEALFLATAGAAVERAIVGFASEAPMVDLADHAAAFARHLRPALPVLLEMAKRVTQESGPTIAATVGLFADLARRLGRIVNQDGGSEHVLQAGGWLIMLAVVKLFEELMGSAITDDRGLDA
jgi:AcrR family transcriptional regulator